MLFTDRWLNIKSVGLVFANKDKDDLPPEKPKKRGFFS